MRLCLFCSGAANSVEDAWPLWITNQFRGKRPSAVQAERGGVTLPSWNTYQPEMKIRCVCRQCNNGWMSVLEERVQPFLQPLLIGQPRVLDADAQTAIATWAVKTAMVLEGMDAPPKKGYSQLQRERLRLRAALPWRTSVWLAASADHGWFMSTKNRHLNESSGDISGTSTTMAFACVVLQVFTMRVPDNVGPGTLVTAQVRRGPWMEATVPIWPPRESANWPPPLALNGELGLDTLADRFSATGCDVDEIDELPV
jgi:hypothetical protein